MSTYLSRSSITWEKQPVPGTIGLALGGGAARGLAHIGVLQALEENGIFPDYIVGTSVGALIGGLYAAGISATRMAHLAATTRWRNLLSVNIPSVTFSNLSFAGGNIPFLENATGFFDLDKLSEWIESVLGGQVTFEQLNIPFAAVTTDLVTGEPLLINTGPVAPAIRISCSVPGIFTPVRRNGRQYVDGGVSLNLPVAAVREMGADYIIAVDLLPSGGATVFSRTLDMEYEPRHIVDVAMHALYALIRVTQRDVNPADCVITPAVGHLSFTNLGVREELIARGRAATEEMLPRLLYDLGRAPALRDEVGDGDGPRA